MATKRFGVWRESAMTSHISIKRTPQNTFVAETMGKSVEAPTEAQAARGLKELVEQESKVGQL